jgi:nucleoside-diphosphate-sugar epimerase
MKEALVCGAGGFIGNHLVYDLALRGYDVTGIDLVFPEYNKSAADEFIIGDLRDQRVCDRLLKNRQYDEVYQLAADMGGAGYIFTGENDANIIHNSALINLNILERSKNNVGKIFFSSSACVYNADNQRGADNPICFENSAIPANPDSDYGWEKLFSERLYLAFSRNYSLPTRIARFHNVFGIQGAWNNGKEKAPAAICRKVAIAKATGANSIEIWGDGEQTRSFLYIDECLDGVRRLMESDFSGPVNIGSDEMVSIDALAKMVMGIANADLEIRHIPGPLGVRGRKSDNTLIYEKLGWKPLTRLQDGLAILYKWIEERVDENNIL